MTNGSLTMRIYIFYWLMLAKKRFGGSPIVSANEGCNKQEAFTECNIKFIKERLSPNSFITELFHQTDQKRFRSVNVAEPIQLLVLNHFANELSAMFALSGYHLVLCYPCSEFSTPYRIAASSMSIFMSFSVLNLTQ